LAKKLYVLITIFTLLIEPSITWFPMQPKVILCKICNLTLIFLCYVIIMPFQLLINETVSQEFSPVKLAPLPQNMTELRRSRMNSDRHEVHYLSKSRTSLLYVGMGKLESSLLPCVRVHIYSHGLGHPAYTVQ
jgi:hypothetical protein